MTARNQNKPPAPRSPVNKNRVVDDVPLDKRRKVGTGRIMASTSSSRGRQALAPMNNQKDVTAAPSETEGSECDSIEFTKEEVDALLSERFKGKKFDSKGKQEWMADNMKKLKLCIKWFQKIDEGHVQEKENLRKMLDSSERKCDETEAAMKAKDEEFNSIISELETRVASLKESLAKEESEKLDALDRHKSEKEARVALEMKQDSLREELGKAEQNAINANEKVKTHEDMYKRLQEYNTSLQQYNTKLQNDLKVAADASRLVEKATILENHNTLRGHYSLLQKEFTSANMSISSDNNSYRGGGFFIRTAKFVNNQVFGSREELVEWVQNLTNSLGFAVVTKRSNKRYCGFLYKVVLQCDCGGEYRVKDSSKVSGTKKNQLSIRIGRKIFRSI